MKTSKMLLQIKEDGDLDWATLNTAEVGDQTKWKAELEEKLRMWRASQYPNAQYRIVGGK